MPNIDNKTFNDHARRLKLTMKLRKGGALTKAQEELLKRLGGAYPHKHSPSDEKRAALRKAKRDAKAAAEQEALLAKVAESNTPAVEKCSCSACAVTPHASDCAVHNEPAYPNGPCDCGVEVKA
jgi:hypothetical protein